jgi:hypothetical protein
LLGEFDIKVNCCVFERGMMIVVSSECAQKMVDYLHV